MKVTGIIKRGEIYWFRKLVDGKRHCVSLKTSDPAEALSLAAAYSRTMNTQSRDTISAVAAKCLADKMASGAIRKKTATSSKNAVRALVKHLGDVTASHVTPDQASKFYQYLRTTMSEAGAQCYMRSLRSIWSWIAAKHHLPVNPFSLKMKKLAKSPRRDFVSAADRDKLIKKAKGEMKLILMLGFHAGFRKMEIVEARPEWFDLENGLIHVSKTETFVPKDSDDRPIPMKEVLKDFLKTYKKLPSPFVVAPDVVHGRAEYRYDFRRPFNEFVATHKVACTSHTMRRTFASLLVSSGVSIYKVAKWLGDEVATVEKSYAHLIANDKDIDRIDRN